MKKIILVVALFPLLNGNTNAESFTFNPNLAIPDGGSANDPQNISSSITSIQSMQVTLSISAVGADDVLDGDLWAVLQHSTGGGPDSAWLLNRIGTTDASNFLDAGNSGNGMTVTLSDAAPNGDIHVAPSPDPHASLTGNWQPDGRSTSPDTVKPTDPRNALLAVFNNADANGTWTLFLGDASPGAGQAKLDSWGLEFFGVPEPREWAAISAVGLLGFAIWRRTKRGRTEVVS